MLGFLKSTTQNDLTLFQQKINHSRLARLIVVHHSYWINHSVFASVTPRALQELSAWPEVKSIYRNQTIHFPSVSFKETVSAPVAYPYWFKAIGMDRVVQAYPELTGKGVVLGSVDTGVDGTHRDLQGKVIRFLKGKTRTETAPVDDSGHDTATVGLMVGGSRQGPYYGVAPDAKVIAASGMDDIDTLFYSLEWMLEAHPRAVNNSWSAPTQTPGSVFYKIIEAYDAAGVFFVASAGNAGNKPHSITMPHEHPLVFSAGAIDEKGGRWSYSSQGPATYLGQEVNKPEVMAPGDEIQVTIPYRVYGAMSGTSFAAPQVTGATALVLQAVPELTPAQLRKLFITTTHQVSGTPQGDWNGQFGYGVIDVEAAIKQALNIRAKLEGTFMNFFSGFSIQSPEDTLSELILEPDLSPYWDPDSGK